MVKVRSPWRMFSRLIPMAVRDGGGEHGVLDVVERRAPRPSPGSAAPRAAGSAPPPRRARSCRPLSPSSSATARPLARGCAGARSSFSRSHGDVDRLGRAVRRPSRATRSSSALSTQQSWATSTTTRLTSASSSRSLIAAHAQVVGGDVEHRAHLALAPAEPGAHDAAARRLQHRRVDRRDRAARGGSPTGRSCRPATVSSPSM